MLREVYMLRTMGGNANSAYAPIYHKVVKPSEETVLNNTEVTGYISDIKKSINESENVMILLSYLEECVNDNNIENATKVMINLENLGFRFMIIDVLNMDDPNLLDIDNFSRNYLLTNGFTGYTFHKQGSFNVIIDSNEKLLPAYSLIDSKKISLEYKTAEELSGIKTLINDYETLYNYGLKMSDYTNLAKIFQNNGYSIITIINEVGQNI